MDKKKLIQLLIDKGIYKPEAMEDLTAPPEPLEINTVGVATSTAMREPLWPKTAVMAATELFSDEYLKKVRGNDDKSM